MIERLREAAGRYVSRETFDRLSQYVALLIAVNREQNLVSDASLKDVWTRHILDSAQLLRFETISNASWVDIGAGAGLPGVVIACLAPGRVTMIEPRRLRGAFLGEVIDKLNLDASVIACKSENASGSFDMITARAVAPLCRLLEISRHLSTRKTRWVLPKGRSARSELAEARSTWQGQFHVERSFTDPEAEIIIASEIKARFNDPNRGR